jgi:uncharacterized membrane protein
MAELMAREGTGAAGNDAADRRDDVAGRMSLEEEVLLARLRELDPARQAGAPLSRSVAERIADRLAAEVGSWRFLVLQSIFLAAWLILNVVGWISAWDPYPFILLNLLLSFQAAYTAPVIMMSQNSQAAIDRYHAVNEYEINLKAALEIKLLQQKLDAVMSALEAMKSNGTSPAGARSETEFN